MNIKTKKCILAAFAALSAALGVGFAVWRTVLIKMFFDPYMLNYENGSADIFRTFELVLVIFAAIFAFSAIFVRGCKFENFSERTSTTSVSVCAVCGFLMGAIPPVILAYNSAKLFKPAPESLLFRVLYLISLFMMLLVALYFLSSAACIFEKSRAKAQLSLFLPLFPAFYLAASYFNYDYTYTDSSRISCNIALISIVLFSLSETRLAIGRSSHAFHFAASLICLVCTCAYVLPMLFLTAFWEMNVTMETTTELCIACYMVYAAFSAFNAVRTLSPAEAPKEAPGTAAEPEPES